MYRVLPALKSVVPFAFTQNTYVKVKGMKSIFPMGSFFLPEASDTEAELCSVDTESDKEQLMCINSVGDMQVIGLDLAEDFI